MKKPAAARKEIKTERVLRIHAKVVSSHRGMSTKDILGFLEEEFPEQKPANLKRYLYEDLKLLEGLGYLERTSGKKVEEVRWKGVNLIEATKSLSLDLRELLALYLAKNALQPLQHSPLYQDLERLFDKVEMLIGHNCREHLESLREEWHFSPGPQWGLGVSSELLDTVNRACEGRMMLEVQYDSVNSKSRRRRVLGPHFLYIAQGSIYLIAEDVAERKIKTFALPRMQNTEILKVKYKGERTNPKAYFKNAFGIFRTEKFEKIRVEVLSPMASHVKERRWHASQQIINLPSGRIEVQFQVGITPEIIQWVLSLGEFGIVHEPESLRAAIFSSAQQISKNHKKAS